MLGKRSSTAGNVREELGQSKVTEQELDGDAFRPWLRLLRGNSVSCSVTKKPILRMSLFLCL